MAAICLLRAAEQRRAFAERDCGGKLGILKYVITDRIAHKKSGTEVNNPAR